MHPQYSTRYKHKTWIINYKDERGDGGNAADDGSGYKIQPGRTITSQDKHGQFTRLPEVINNVRQAIIDSVDVMTW